jgi:hypothetical protein
MPERTSYTDTEEKLLSEEVENLKCCSADTEENGKRLKRTLERRKDLERL